MKIHLMSGLVIGAAINLAFQLTDAAFRFNLLELAASAVLAALASALASWFQQPFPVCGRARLGSRTSALRAASLSNHSRIR
jgi:hypothetical protein